MTRVSGLILGTRLVFIVGRDFYHPHENPRRNSGTKEPAVSPVVSHFPHAKNYEVTIHKNAEPGRNGQDISDGNE